MPVGYPPQDGSLWMMRWPNIWQELKEPCANGVIGRVGPAGMFGWYRQQQTGAHVAVVNCAVGGMISAQQDPTSPYIPTGFSQNVYHTALARIVAAMSLPGAAFRGFVCYDGANDAIQFNTIGLQWRGRWNTIIAAFRSALGTSAPVIYTQLPPTVPAGAPGWNAVRNDQAAWQAADRIMVTAQDSGPWRDQSVHLSTEGNRLLAQSYAAAAASMVP